MLHASLASHAKEACNPAKVSTFFSCFSHDFNCLCVLLSMVGEGKKWNRHIMLIPIPHFGIDLEACVSIQHIDSNR